MTTPATISELLFNTAEIDDASSGKEVPKATIVTPMMKGDTPSDKPIRSAESTNQSEPFINTKRLPPRTKKLNNNPNTIRHVRAGKSKDNNWIRAIQQLRVSN
jgi:hypothetical protein